VFGFIFLTLHRHRHALPVPSLGSTLFNVLPACVFRMPGLPPFQIPSGSSNSNLMSALGKLDCPEPDARLPTLITHARLHTAITTPTTATQVSVNHPSLLNNLQTALERCKIRSTAANCGCPAMRKPTALLNGKRREESLLFSRRSARGDRQRKKKKTPCRFIAVVRPLCGASLSCDMNAFTYGPGMHS
jgi:hypothetical protein